MIEFSTRTKAEIAAGMAALAVIWHFAASKPSPVETWQAAQPATAVSGASKESINPPQVVVYAPKAKHDLDLPPAVRADQDKYVLAADTVKPDLHPQTVVTVIDNKTGISETLVRRDSYPWLAAEQTGALWLGYGVANGHTVSLLSVSEDLLQVKAFHFGVAASLSSDGSTFAGLGVGWKW